MQVSPLAERNCLALVKVNLNVVGYVVSHCREGWRMTDIDTERRNLIGDSTPTIAARETVGELNWRPRHREVQLVWFILGGRIELPRDVNPELGASIPVIRTPLEQEHVTILLENHPFSALLTVEVKHVVDELLHSGLLMLAKEVAKLKFGVTELHASSSNINHLCDDVSRNTVRYR